MNDGLRDGAAERRRRRDRDLPAPLSITAESCTSVLGAALPRAGDAGERLIAASAGTSRCWQRDGAACPALPAGSRDRLGDPFGARPARRSAAPERSRGAGAAAGRPAIQLHRARPRDGGGRGAGLPERRERGRRIRNRRNEIAAPSPRPDPGTGQIYGFAPHACNSCIASSPNDPGNPVPHAYPRHPVRQGRDAGRFPAHLGPGNPCGPDASGQWRPASLRSPRRGEPVSSPMGTASCPARRSSVSRPTCTARCGRRRWAGPRARSSSPRSTACSSS